MCHALADRVRLLLSKGHSCYRPRRTGERKRKSVRGCIVDANLSVLALMIVKKGEGVSVHTIFQYSIVCQSERQNVVDCF